MKVQMKRNEHYDHHEKLIAEQAKQNEDLEATVKELSKMLTQQAETIAQLTKVCSSKIETVPKIDPMPRIRDAKSTHSNILCKVIFPGEINSLAKCQPSVKDQLTEIPHFCLFQEKDHQQSFQGEKHKAIIHNSGQKGKQHKSEKNIFFWFQRKNMQ